MELAPVEGDPGSLRVTFEWHGDAARVAVIGGPAVPPDNLLERGADGVFRRSYVVPRAVRTVYGFLPDPPDEPEWGPELWYAIRPDPLNPASYVFPGDEEDPGWERDAFRSVLEGPDAPPDVDSVERPDVARGTVRPERFRSDLLGNERRVWLYEPQAPPAGLLVVLDGWAYLNLIPTPTILDNLIAEGAIPPLAAVLPDSLDGATRARELRYDEPFLAFLVDELLPWARRELGAPDDPRLTIAAGSSAGGATAAFAAWRRPDVFGAALSQSGAFWFDGEWLTDRLAGSAPLPVRLSLQAGLLETAVPPGEGASILTSNRRLRDVLVERRQDLRYAEFAGGHDYLCWAATLGDGLRGLAPQAA